MSQKEEWLFALPLVCNFESIIHLDMFWQENLHEKLDDAPGF